MSAPLETNRLGRRLRRLRGQDPVGVFAERVGMSGTFLHDLETGRRLPSDEVLADLAARLGIDVGELILLAYLDRSPLLGRYLAERGVQEARGTTD